MRRVSSEEALCCSVAVSILSHHHQKSQANVLFFGAFLHESYYLLQPHDHLPNTLCVLSPSLRAQKQQDCLPASVPPIFKQWYPMQIPSLKATGPWHILKPSPVFILAAHPLQSFSSELTSFSPIQSSQGLVPLPHWRTKQGHSNQCRPSHASLLSVQSREKINSAWEATRAL